jgi:uncharacterized membrane protein
MYIKSILFISCIMVVISCQNNKAPKTQPESPSQIEPLTTAALDTFYIGSGNEPGWMVTLLSDKKGTLSYDLLLDYGERHLTGDVSKMPSPGQNMATHFMLKTAEKPLILSITSSPCTDDGDFEFETSVTLSDKKFVLNGCGNFISKE